MAEGGWSLVQHYIRKIGKKNWVNILGCQYTAKFDNRLSLKRT